MLRDEPSDPLTIISKFNIHPGVTCAHAGRTHSFIIKDMLCINHLKAIN